MKEQSGIVSIAEPLISVIVPVYKVETYLEKCVDSILAQTYKHFELFLVDDGSPDRCGAICDEYAQKYPFIHAMHQSNQGQAAARNSAARQAKGDFFVFVDSDDFVEPDCLSYLLSLQKKYDADIAIGGFVYLYEGKEKPEQRMETQERCMNTIEALNCLNYTKGYGAFPWAKLYKRQLILKHPFPEGQIYEDLAVMYRIFSDAKKIAYGNRVIYYWLQRKGSTMRSAFDKRQLAALAATNAQIEYMKENYPSALPSAKARHEAKIVELMSIALNSQNSRESYRELKCQMRFFHEVLKDKNVKRSLKYRMRGIRMGYLPAKIVFNLHEKMKERRFG